MTSSTQAARRSGLLLIIALVLAACGGGTATPTPTPVGVGTPSTEPGASVDPGASVEPGTSVDPAAIPSFDLGALTGGLPGVDSYRTSWTTGGVLTSESVVVTKPVLSKAITTYDSDGSIDSRYIVIDKAVWQAQGTDGEFESVPDALATSLLLFLDPTVMLSGFANVQWAQAASDLGAEDKNGVKTRHLRIDSTTLGGVGMPAGSAVDVWVAEAGYLIAWEMTGLGTGQDISIQVTNVNDPANVVEAP